MTTHPQSVPLLSRSVTLDAPTRGSTRQANFELIAETIPHIVWLASHDGQVEYLNRHGLRYTGLTHGALHGTGWLALVHPDDVESVGQAWQRAVESGRACNIECRLRGADGAFRRHHVSVEPVCSEGRRTIRWIGTCTDVEERARLEGDVARARRTTLETASLLETLLRTAPVGFGFVDRDFRYRHVNETLARFNGRSIEQHLGRRVADLLPDLWPQIEPQYRRIVETGEPLTDVEMTGPTPADPGRTRHWLVSLYPVAARAEIIGIGIVVLDVTERKQAEEAHRTLTRAAVDAMAAAVEARDPYTAGHQRRVADIAAVIATEMGVDPGSIDGIWLAASIHDIGKIGIPGEILAKPARLHPAEWELVKTHSRVGHDIVAGIAFPWPVAEMILQHHERLDGSGYPDGLRGDEIGVGARVIAIADTIEAMASHRPYRPALGLDAALDVIVDGRGTLYDADAVEACLRVFHRRGMTLDAFTA